VLVAFLGLALIIPNLVALIGWVLALTGIQGSAFPEPPTTPRRATRGFLADAAHELRTPIAGIQAAAEQQRHRQPERRRGKSHSHRAGCRRGIETTTLAPEVSCVISVITAESVLILPRR